jgi:hypothetical protein
MIDSTATAVVFRGFISSRVEVGAANRRRPKGASMDADLDRLLTAVYVTADDLLPEKPENAKRSVTDATSSRCAWSSDHGHPV